ncbi:MAG TPA: AAA family ATPase, partial [Kofleriaceae bacterium]|nr:AAA family ATPase [Kofleriaceae bacterium]
MTGHLGEGETLARLAAATPARPVALGRYDVVGRLGQGGMGTVHDGVDRERGTRVALKTLSAVDGAAALRLKREFRAVADLAHPNLAGAYELACVDGLWFFAMEHVDGVGFTRWARGPSRDEQATARMPLTQQAIDSGAPTQELTEELAITRAPAPAPPAASAPLRPLAIVRAALAELARGLAALHAAGLWHGDVKPENVLVRADGSVVVVDFGLVEPVDERGGRGGQGGSTGGTPLYMAPEQLGAGQPGPASDWYAVGTMLYEVLTGRLPFDAESLLDLYFQKSHQVPVAPRELVPEVPEDLSELCMSLLQAAPERRPSGAELVRLFAGDEVAGRLAADGPVRSGFVGRKRELRVLEQAYGLARGGQAMVVHAVGPSGIGKTAMLRSFTRGVEDVDGAIVLRGRCYERESVPYKAFDGIVDALAERLRGIKARLVAELVPAHGAELAQVFPALAGLPGLVAADAVASAPGVEAVELRRRAWAALAELLDRLAVARPLVLSIDDLQWADADSAGLLATLVADPGRRHQLVLVGYRQADAEANPVLRGYLELAARLAAERRLVEIAVGPLPRAEAELLARTALRGLGGAADEASLRFLADEASGVPFFIEELARFAAAGRGAPARTISLDDAI